MIPLELLTGGVSLVVGMVGQLMANKMRMTRENNRDTLRALTGNTKAQNAAYERGKGDEKFAWTRRLIALSVVFAVLILPKLVAIFNPDVMVYVGYTEAQGGIFSWIFGGDGAVIWKEAQGLVLTPLDTHTVAAIIGLYFGSSTTKI